MKTRSARLTGVAAIGCMTGSVLAGGVDLQPRMGDPIPGMTPEQMTAFLAGQNDYNTPFLAEEGLGPIFNKESCGNCHNNPLGGTGSQTVTRAGFADKGGFDSLEMFGGPLFQQQAIDEDCAEVVHASANVMTLRVTNGMLGYGLVEAIEDADILALESSPPGVSGKARMVEAFEDPGVMRVGRFGWKAQLPTILSFSADAALMEIGLTNRFLMTENDPNGINPPSIAECDTVPDPEDGPDENGDHFIDRVTVFQQFLAQPPQTPKTGMSGETIFNTIGCADCHHPSFVTSNDPSVPDPLRNQAIRPYSDFLLHDMGLAADFIPDGAATDREIRTPPLWGVRVRDPLWHDGRFGGDTFANRVTLAIEEHGVFGSEAIDSADNFDSLSGADKTALIAFLDSLGRIEFDGDGDGVIDIIDFLSFGDCMGNGPYTADDPCAVHDLDQDGDVDLDDFDGFLLAYDGDLEDCNNNGTPDFVDILTGASPDLNGDGQADDCCPGDFDNSGAVDFNDIVSLLSAWGTCVDCPQDLDGNGEVAFNDLLAVLSAYGPCP